MTWGADNRTLVYASERDGKWDLYRATIVRDEEKGFPNATVLREERLLPESKFERTLPQFSPDGKQLAFIEDRNRLMVVDLDSKKVHQVTDGSTWYGTGGGFDYRWSPTGGGLPSSSSATATTPIRISVWSAPRAVRSRT